MLVLVGMATFVQDVPEDYTSQMLEMRPVLIAQLVTPLRWRELTMRNNVVSTLEVSFVHITIFFVHFTYSVTFLSSYLYCWVDKV